MADILSLDHRAAHCRTLALCMAQKRLQYMRPSHWLRSEANAQHESNVRWCPHACVKISDGQEGCEKYCHPAALPASLLLHAAGLHCLLQPVRVFRKILRLFDSRSTLFAVVATEKLTAKKARAGLHKHV